MFRRDWNDPAYKAWRKKVYARDRYKCRFPGCTYYGKKLEAHHIKRACDFPNLIHVVSNGITLCKNHHKLVTSRETFYEEMFDNIISPKNLDVVSLMYKMRQEND